MAIDDFMKSLFNRIHKDPDFLAEQFSGLIDPATDISHVQIGMKLLPPVI